MELRTTLSASMFLLFTFALTAQEAMTGCDGGKHPQRAAVDNGAPEGLSEGDWSSIRAVYEAHRHAIVRVDDGFEARNPGQRWRTHFDDRGFTVKPDGTGWSWGLELKGWGFAGDELPVQPSAAVRVDGQRMTYVWSGELSEWWINDRRGLEHGFTVHRRPVQSPVDVYAPLMFALAVRGPLLPVVSEDGLAASFTNSDGSNVLTYSGLVVFDADRKVLQARMEVVGGDLCIAIDERDARYPLTIDPIAQQAYLKASNTENGDNFGFSVAVAGSTVVVGAHNEDSGSVGVNGSQISSSAPASGAAYVFIRSMGIWTQQAYLKASNTETYDRFGFSVAISGDTIVVGAPMESSDSTGVNGSQANGTLWRSGAAYVFVRSGANWTQQAYLKASNTGFEDEFGYKVSVSGDRILVGAHREDSSAVGINNNQSDNSALNSGAAYIFKRSGTTWSQDAYVKASNTNPGDHFSAALSISGDTAVVGAWLESSAATGVNGNQSSNSAQFAGAAYVFVRTTQGWSQEAYLKASNTDTDDRFGISVSVSGNTVIVGASREDSSATGVNGNQNDNSVTDAGAVYVFTRNGTIWSQEAYLKASNSDYRDIFGYTCSISGDIVVVGAFREDSNATGINGNQSDNSASASGAAYIFVRTGSMWSQQAYLKASNSEASDWFGISVSVSGDTVVVGAEGEDGSATGVNGNEVSNGSAESGAAYVFLVPLGNSVVLGTGCGSASTPLTLAASAPQLGQVATLSLINATPSALGMLYRGTLNPVPVPVTLSCNLYLSFPSLQLIQGFTTDALGSWSMPVSLPLDPALAGLQLDLQAAVVSNSSPIGLDLTNGLSVVLGY